MKCFKEGYFVISMQYERSALEDSKLIQGLVLFCAAPVYN